MIITKKQIEVALREGTPFAIKMADGRERQVQNANQVHVADTHLIFIDNRVLVHALPLFTITGFSYLNLGPKKRR